MEHLKIETEFEVVQIPNSLFVVTARALTINDDLICTQHGCAPSLEEAEDNAVDRLLTLINKINANTKRAA